MTRTHTTLWAALGTLALIVAVIGLLSAGASADEPSGDGLLPDNLLTDRKLGSQLNNLLGAVNGRGYSAADGAEFAGSAAGHAADTAGPNSKVAVIIFLDSGIEQMKQYLISRGVEPGYVGSDSIEAYVPLRVLGDVARQPGVNRIREIDPPRALEEPLQIKQTSPQLDPHARASVKAHLADHWHALGRKGRGVRIGVLDGPSSSRGRDGFAGLPELMGKRLPSKVVGLCFRDIGKSSSNLADCTQSGDTHGTRVAESAFDIAPEASLYISNPKTWGDLRTATEWMASQGVDIIVHSVGWLMSGPGDGTSRFDSSPVNTVKFATEQGMLWVNAAGNSHGDAWYGSWTDTDNDNYLDWKSGQNNALQWLGGSTTFMLRWDDDWDGAKTDLDLVIVKNGVEVAVGGDLQTGEKGDDPIEILRFRPQASGVHNLKVKLKSGPAPAWVHLLIWFPVTSQSFAQTTNSHEITSPADDPTPGLVAVGATHVNDLLTVEDYSSRGPNTQGDTKPEVVGVDCTTLSHGNAFCGTSQAAPHVAGLAALFLAEYPTLTPTQLEQMLIDHAVDRGVAGPDKSWGHGLAELPPVTCDPYELYTNSDVQASWLEQCNSEVSGRGHSRYYQFVLDQAATITLTLESQLDTQLYLRAGADTRSGTAIADNDNDTSDDPNGTRISKIEQTLSAGSYTVEATTVGAPQLGDYVLKIGGFNATNNTRPQVSISGHSAITEGNQAIFTITLDSTPTTPRDINVSVTQLGDAVANQNIRIHTVNVTGTSATLTIPTSDDSVNDRHGQIVAYVAPGTGYEPLQGSRRATVTINDNDNPPPLDTMKQQIEDRLTEASNYNDPWSWEAWTRALHAISGTFPPAALKVMTSSEAYELAKGHQAGHRHELASQWQSVGDIIHSTPPPATYTIAAGPDLTEGGNAVFTITADPPSTARTVTVTVSQNGQYLASTNIGTHTVTIPQNSTATLTLAVPQDADDESDGSITASLDNGRGKTVFATVQVLDDDTPAGAPVLTLTPGADVREGDTASFSITANPIPSQPMTVYVDVQQHGRVASENHLGSQPVTIYTYGSNSLGVLNVPTNNDSNDEDDATIIVTLKEDVGYSVSNRVATASLTVLDNDDPNDLEQRIFDQIELATKNNDNASVYIYRRALAGTRYILPPDGSPPLSIHEAIGHRDAETDAALRTLWQDIVNRLIYHRPHVYLDVEKSHITEGENGVLIVRTRNKPPLRPITVSISLAIQGNYNFPFFNPDVTLGTDGIGRLSFPTLDNAVDEPTATLNFLIQTDSEYSVDHNYNHGERANWIKVRDNDPAPPPTKGPPLPVISITGNGEINEGDTAVFTVTVNPPGGLHRVSVSLNAGGRAKPNHQTFTVALPASGTTTFSIATIDDNIQQPNTSVTARIINGYGYDVSPTAGTAKVKVMNDETVTATIEAGPDITEGQPATFTITLDPPPDRQVKVIVRTTQVGRTSHHFYRWTTDGVYIPASGTATLKIPTTNDQIDEINGSFTATIIESSAKTYTPDPNKSAATLTIADNDLPFVNISYGKAVSEGEDATITLSVTHYDTPVAIDVNYQILGSGGYVTPRTGTITIPTSGKAALTVPTIDNDTEGPDGSVYIFLQSGTGYRYYGNRTDKNVIIKDNDQAVVVMPMLTISAGADVSEGAHATFTLTATPPPTAPLVVTVDITQSGDFVTASQQTVTIADTGTATLTLPTTDDDTDEPDGTVTATLADGTDYDVGTPSDATVKVADDDDPPVVVEPEITIQAGADITEGGAATFTLTASPPPAAPLPVTVSVTQSGDFAATAQQTVTVPATGSFTLSVPTTDDSIDEPDGSITVTVQAGNGYSLGSASAATVAVSDNDDPPLDVFVPDQALVALVQDKANKHPNPDAQERLQKVVDGMLGKTDGYDSAECRQVAQSFRVAGIWKPWCDEIERRENSASKPPPPPPPPPPPTPEVTITAGAAVTEGTAATFTITASPSPASSLDVSVNVTQSGDFVTVGSQTVTIPPTGSVTLTIATTNDNVDESDGSVTVTLQAGSGYTLGSASAATVAVSDDDDPPPDVFVPDQALVDLVQDKANNHPNPDAQERLQKIVDGMLGKPDGYDSAECRQVAQNYNVASVWKPWCDEIERRENFASKPPPPVQPQLTIVSGGSVTEGADAIFTIVATPAATSPLIVSLSATQLGNFASSLPSTVTLTGGSAIVRIPTLNDSVDEPNGSITVALSSGSGYTLGSANAATVAVSDNDVPVPQTPELTISGGAGITEGSDAVFTISASPDATSQLTVNLSVTQQGSFASSLPSTVTLSGGSATLRIATVNDSTHEADGSITVTLSSGGGYTVGSSSTATVAVSDDDPTPVTPVVSITGGAAITEGGDAVFSLTASPPPAALLTVNVTLSQQGEFTAAATAQTVTIGPSGTATLNIATINDSTDEPDGSVMATLQSGNGYTVGSSATATIDVSDDDDAPQAGSLDCDNSGLIVDEFSVTEPRWGQYAFVRVLVKFCQPYFAPKYIDYSIAHITTDDDDLLTNGGTLVFDSVTNEKHINITVKRDRKTEGNETFALVLSLLDPAHIDVGHGRVLGTISDP